VSKASPQLSFATHLLDGDLGTTLHGLIQLVPQAFFVAAEREKKNYFLEISFSFTGNRQTQARQTTNNKIATEMTTT